MSKRVMLEEKKPATPTRPALNPENREQQIINEAMNLAERQIREGTASSQVITHFLKAGSVKEKYELERLRNEVELLRAKTKALEEHSQLKEMYADAMNAFKYYQGVDEEGDINENINI